ncbi:MAG: hypothetical protein ABJM86_03090 [Hyphomicrobiales bacterium]
MQNNTNIYDPNIVMVPMTGAEFSNALNLIPDMKLSEFCKMNGVEMSALTALMRENGDMPLWIRSWMMLATANPNALNTVRMMMDATLDLDKLAAVSKATVR